MGDGNISVRSRGSTLRPPECRVIVDGADRITPRFETGTGSVLWKTAVTPRHVALTVAALAVLGLGVYLFVQVQADPVRAQVTAPTKAPERVATADPKPAKEPPVDRRFERANRAMTMPAPAVRQVAAADPKPALNATEIKNLDATMSEANKAYDRGDFGEAKDIARKVLAEDPNNVRMLRIMVSASCIEGESVEAQQAYLKLPPPDRKQMQVRCARYGVSFDES